MDGRRRKWVVLDKIRNGKVKKGYRQTYDADDEEKRIMSCR